MKKTPLPPFCSRGVSAETFLVSRQSDPDSKRGGRAGAGPPAAPTPAVMETAARKAAQESLLLTAAEAVRAYNLLEVRRFDSILRNILEEGLFSVQKQIFEPEAAQRVK